MISKKKTKKARQDQMLVVGIVGWIYTNFQQDLQEEQEQETFFFG